ncbi:MAG: hypothetical protein AAF570_05825, partial [Bacteroidota bacterium]
MKKNYLTITLFSLLLIFAGRQTTTAQGLSADDKNALMNVVVTDFEGNPLAGEYLFFRAESSGKTVRKRADESGKFQIRLPKGDTYGIHYESFLEKQEYDRVKVPSGAGLIEGTLSVQIRSIVDETYSLDIHFETDK